MGTVYSVRTQCSGDLWDCPGLGVGGSEIGTPFKSFQDTGRSPGSAGLVSLWWWWWGGLEGWGVDLHGSFVRGEGSGNVIRGPAKPALQAGAPCSVSVLVCSSFSAWLITNRSFSVWSLGAQGQSAGRFSVWRGLLPGSQMAFSCCVVTRQGAQELSGVSFIRAPIALMGAPPS